MIKPLTDEEKMECVVRWLNGLFFAFYNGGYKTFEEKISEETMSIRESINKPYDPCSMCSIYDSKCRFNRVNPDIDRSRLIHAPQDYWKILERYTGEDTVINGALFLQEVDTQRDDTDVSQHL